MLIVDSSSQKVDMAHHPPFYVRGVLRAIVRVPAKGIPTCCCRLSTAQRDLLLCRWTDGTDGLEFPTFCCQTAGSYLLRVCI